MCIFYQFRLGLTKFCGTLWKRKFIEFISFLICILPQSWKQFWIFKQQKCSKQIIHLKHAFKLEMMHISFLFCKWTFYMGEEKAVPHQTTALFKPWLWQRKPYKGQDQFLTLIKILLTVTRNTLDIKVCRPPKTHLKGKLTKPP